MPESTGAESYRHDVWKRRWAGKSAVLPAMTEDAERSDLEADQRVPVQVAP
jgi:hypothetical protein